VTTALIRRRPGEIPAEVTGFVGRQAELAQVASLLETARLVTVTGPGGVGKTRVSLRAAEAATGRYTDGVCLVELSGLRDTELLPHTVAASLGLPQSDSQLDAVLDFLCKRELLLILDTCEHLLDGCAMLADAVLRTAPRVTVLATSRQPLDVPGEHTYSVPPLPVPDAALPASTGAVGNVPRGTAPAGDGGGDAVELFAQRAAAAVPGFAITAENRADVIRVCRRLDGIPLAIELATVRLRALPLEELAGRLERRFRVLTGGLRTALPRHQTLRTAIEWSHDLCTPAERVLWSRLSVFAGTFDVAAAEDVCTDGELDRDEIVDALIGLVDKSVLLREDGGGTRYRLLDTLREFGAEQLSGWGREAEFRTRHIARYLATAEYFAEHLIDDDQLAQCRAMSTEHANIRAALEYALGMPGGDGEAARLAAALAPYWQISGMVEEGKYWLIRVLERFPGPSPERASALIARCRLHVDAYAEGQEGIAIAEQLGEELLAARGYLCLQETFGLTGQIVEARRAGAIAEERLQALGDPIGLFCLDSQMCQMYALAGESELALEHCARGLRRAAGRGEVWQTSYLHCMGGLALIQQGKYSEGAEAQHKAVTMMADIGDIIGVAYCLEMLGWLAARQRRLDRAAWLLGAAGGTLERAGQHIGLYAALIGPHQQAVDAVRDAFGADRYDARYRSGARYPLDQLIPLVISDADKLPQAGAEPASADMPGPLTSREREIAALVAEALSNREIAERLVISKRTVDAHVEHIYAKLGITSRVELVNWLKP
jgi:non-specific serine/threonine protein kinase